MTGPAAAATQGPEPPARGGRTQRWRWGLRLLGVVLLVLVVAGVDRDALAGALVRLDAMDLALAAALFLGNAVIKALRWHRLLGLLDLQMRWRASVGSFLTSAFYGAVTVGRVGEFLRAEPLVRLGRPW